MSDRSFFYSKRKLQSQMIIPTIFSVIVIYLLIFRFDSDPLVKAVGVGVVLLLCGAVVLYLWRQLADRREILVVSDEGFRDLRVSEDFIEWKYIKSIRSVTKRNRVEIHFDTVLPKDRYLKLEGQTARSAVNNSIRIATHPLDASASEIERTLRAKFQNTELDEDTSTLVSYSPSSIRARKRLSQVEGLLIVICFGYMAYGFINFPDAPIHPCKTDQYCGKSGRIHSEAEYKSVSNWETGMFILWTTAMVIGYLIKISKNRV